MRATIVALSIVPLALAGCAVPGPGLHGGVGGATANCADVFASAMASRHAVKGSWGCLTPSIQDQFRAAGLDGDDGLARLASRAPVYSRSKFLGRLEDGGYVYSLGGDAGSSVLLVWLDGGGRVADVRTGGRAAG